MAQTNTAKRASADAREAGRQPARQRPPVRAVHSFDQAGKGP